MKYPYLESEVNMRRPVVPFTISYRNEKPVKYWGLLDSGADHTLIDARLANLIGIEDITTGKEESVEGIGGQSKVYFHPITVNIGGWEFSIDAGFTTDLTLSSIGHGLLGQIGLFDQSTIKFNRRKFEMEIVPTMIDA